MHFFYMINIRHDICPLNIKMDARISCLRTDANLADWIWEIFFNSFWRKTLFSLILILIQTLDITHLLKISSHASQWLQLTFMATHSIDIDSMVAIFYFGGFTYLSAFNDLILCIYIIPIHFNPTYKSPPP